MRKIALFLSTLALLLSAGFVIAANKEPFFSTTITSVNDIDLRTFVGVASPYADGDFQSDGGSGGVYEFNTFIKTNSPNASGNLYLSTFYNTKDQQCFVYGHLQLPLKIENNRIVLPPNKGYRVDNVSYSDEKCRAITGVTHFYVTVEDGNWRYIIKSYANGANG